jgi:hypothetical protein
MGSRLQSNGITPTAKVGTLIQLVNFHSFQTDSVSLDSKWHLLQNFHLLLQAQKDGG